MNGTSEINVHSLWDQGLITIRLRRDFQSNTKTTNEETMESIS
jgi:hypothetical protein